MPIQLPAFTEEDWRAARRQGITASDVACILGLSPWTSPWTLYHRKREELPEQPDNDAMALGRYLEDFICQRWAQRSQLYVWGDGRTLYAHSERRWQMATPDRLVYDGVPDAIDSPPVAVVEAKTDASLDGWGEEGTDAIPRYYRCQALWQMDVMAVDRAYVVLLSLRDRKIRTYIIDRDDDELELMRNAAEDFLWSVREGTPPPVDGSMSTRVGLKLLHLPSDEVDEYVVGKRLARSYASAVRRYRDACERKREVENTMLALMGGAKRAVDPEGELVAFRSRYTVKEHMRAASIVDKLTPARRKNGA